MNKTPGIIYHIYPLGACGAPLTHPGDSPVAYRLAELEQWIPHIRSLHVDTVYLGPVCESETHGYDTLDYFSVDRRLGDSTTMVNLVNSLHNVGIKVVLDAVFNHVGRGHFAFQDVLRHREKSKYAPWFSGLDFSSNNGYGDGFSYGDWSGCQNLVKLDGSNPAVIEHLLSAVDLWVREWGVDGLRLDAADHLHTAFLKSLRTHCDSISEDFWLLGEMVHGDYNAIVGADKLHSATNYEMYKSLYSSFNDGNFFELAYAVNRQFSSTSGIYRNLMLYSFADNHDVNRIASTLKDSAHLPLLYGLLATLPGIPSLYYGSEWGESGVRNTHDDNALRPRVALSDIAVREKSSSLTQWIRTLLQLRATHPVLQSGTLVPVRVDARSYAFVRSLGAQHYLICVNSDSNSVALRLDLPEPLPFEGKAISVLNNGNGQEYGGRVLYLNLPSNSMEIFEMKAN